MKNREFDWTWETTATKHGFSREDIEAAFAGESYIWKIRRDAYMLLGRDGDGHLVEIFYQISGDGKIMPFHCMTMRSHLRKRYQRMRK